MSNKEIQENVVEETIPTTEETVTEEVEKLVEEVAETEEDTSETKGGFSEEQLEQLKPMFPFLEKEYEKYEYGDLHVYCGQCGSDTAMLHPAMKNLQTAYMTQTNIDNHSILSLACGVCGSRLALHVKKAVNPPKNDGKVSEESQESTENK